MRIWSLHPKYLDAAGLVALWRETLLAQKVLQGLTKGYRNHPQLDRFRNQPDPLAAIGAYLTGVLADADSRGYNFDRTKIVVPGAASPSGPVTPIPVTHGQLVYEFEWLHSKLVARSPGILKQAIWTETAARTPAAITAHPIFAPVPGAIEPWERVQ